MNAPKGSAKNSPYGTVTGKNMPIGTGTKKRVNAGGQPVGERPFKKVQFANVNNESSLPITRELDTMARTARPPGGPSFNQSARFPGTQRYGARGVGIPAKNQTYPVRFQEEGGLLSSLSLPSQSIRNTFGWWTNGHTNYQLVVRRSEYDYDRMIEKTMPLFRRLSKKKRDLDDGVDILIHLAYVNYILRVRSKVLEEDPSPYEILEQWGFFGIATEVTLNENMTRTGYIPAMDVTCRINGPVLSMNVWGPNISAGTPLYFILKMVKNIPDEFTLDPNGRRTNKVYSKNEIPEKSFQFIPYANNKIPKPSSNQLEYYDNTGELRRGLLILVGLAQYPPTHRNARASAASAYNANSMVVGSGYIWVLLVSN